MNRWSKIVLGIGVGATCGWVAGGLLGPAAGRGPAALALHTLVTYAATLVWLLADVWILVFLAGSARALRRAAGTAAASAAAASRRVVALGAGAAAAVVAQFAVSGALFPGRMDVRLHLALALFALLLQLAFLVAGGRELARHHRLQQALEAAG